MEQSRRKFLGTALASTSAISLAQTMPSFLSQAAAAKKESSNENVLVVIQLSGGNDGLNTIVPYKNEIYKKSRKKLAISESDVLKIDKEYGLHPNLTGFESLLEKDKLSIIQGVGYPNPNRSHFESMDIWHSCFREQIKQDEGWLGRYLDQSNPIKNGDSPALHLGSEKQPLALAAAVTRTPSISSMENFQLHSSKNKKFSMMVREMTNQKRKEKDGLLGFVQSSASSAIQASQRVKEAMKSYKTDVDYPDFALGQKLKKIAMLIDSGMKTRVYYLTLEGFDTHATQAPAHDSLMQELGDSVAAFLEDISKHGHGKRTMMMCFSEFGRRVQENASAGTDHGAAAPLFLMGENAKSGLIGKHPSLSDLQNGDLKHHTDFRQVYATLLENWLLSPSQKILGQEYKTLNLFKT